MQDITLKSEGEDLICSNLAYEPCIQRLKSRIREVLGMSNQGEVFVLVDSSEGAAKTMIMIKGVEVEKLSIYRYAKVPSQITVSDIGSIENHKFRPQIDAVSVK